MRHTICHATPHQRTPFHTRMCMDEHCCICWHIHTHAPLLINTQGGKLVALCTSSDADATTTTSNTISAHMFTNGTLVASGTCTLKSTHAMQQQLGYTWFTTNATVPVQVTTGVPPNPPKGVATAVVSSALSGTGLLGMMQVCW